MQIASSAFQNPFHSTVPNGTIHHYYLTDEIVNPSCYIDLFEIFDSMLETDYIYLHLNGPGGDLFTTVQILAKMRECRGTVITSAEGLVASAHSIIFFAGQSMMVADHCSFLLHDGSSGEYGKISQNLAGAVSASDHIYGLYHDVYGKFFTEDEIDEILKGDDCWVTSDSVLARLMRVADENKEITDIKDELDAADLDPIE